MFAAESLPDAPRTFYYDETGTLDQDIESLVEQKNLYYMKKKNSPQVIVAAVNSTGDEGIDVYASYLFQKWKIGSKAKNNGVLILYAVNQGKRNVRIEVGYGLEGDLTDALAGKILKDNKSDLKSSSQEKVNRGLQHVFNAVSGVVDYSSGYQTSDRKTGETYLKQMKFKKDLNKFKKNAVKVSIIIYIILAFLIFRDYHHKVQLERKKQKWHPGQVVSVDQKTQNRYSWFLFFSYLYMLFLMLQAIKISIVLLIYLVFEFDFNQKPIRRRGRSSNGGGYSGGSSSSGGGFSGGGGSSGGGGASI
ncbi:hypothetical protein KIMC2_19520 [Xylocopilactobacillus apis]|uniref:TPM domain-containing protein n=1 Tax=Xylocopilactobacillus apis TaxID=2932183 RepID=A0AAU9DC84_9LACO|nr:hypothetical protein KIMC2_19520 [Xylocopilactobacillus apis]